MEHYTTQGAREQDYAASGAFNNKEDSYYLYEFFSPKIVPEGLTDNEIRECVVLQKRRIKIITRLKKEREISIRQELLDSFRKDFRFLEKAKGLLVIAFGEGANNVDEETVAGLFSTIPIMLYDPVPLPEQLRVSPMTRKSFCEGKNILIHHMNTLEID
jgi:hypothetical protein